VRASIARGEARHDERQERTRASQVTAALAVAAII
jgi:hypothetical protein